MCASVNRVGQLTAIELETKTADGRGAAFSLRWNDDMSDFGRTFVLLYRKIRGTTM
jgi:hypothetical protein